ncbi:MAG: hypothetical protein ACK56I_28965, partial [bacterium]
GLHGEGLGLIFGGPGRALLVGGGPGHQRPAQVEGALPGGLGAGPHAVRLAQPGLGEVQQLGGPGAAPRPLLDGAHPLGHRAGMGRAAGRIGLDAGEAELEQLVGDGALQRGQRRGPGGRAREQLVGGEAGREGGRAREQVAEEQAEAVDVGPGVEGP